MREEVDLINVQRLKPFGCLGKRNNICIIAACVDRRQHHDHRWHSRNDLEALDSEFEPAVHPDLRAYSKL